MKYKTTECPNSKLCYNTTSKPHFKAIIYSKEMVYKNKYITAKYNNQKLLTLYWYTKWLFTERK